MIDEQLMNWMMNWFMISMINEAWSMNNDAIMSRQWLMIDD